MMPVKLVDVEVKCKVLDFTMGVSKVVFSNKNFGSADSAMQWLQTQAEKDDLARIIRNQISKYGVRDRTTDEGFEYDVYGDSMMTCESPTECELYDGVTVAYGTIQQCVPVLK
jgi:hypothetical protein